MDSFWLPEVTQSRASSPNISASPGTTASFPASLATLNDRTIVSAPASQTHFPINLPPEENPDPISPSKVARSRRSFFTSKFKLFKARRTTVSVASDAMNHPSASIVVDYPASLMRQASQYQPNPALEQAQALSPMIGLGLVGLEFDPLNGKYHFKDWPRTPSGGSSYTMDRAGSDATRSSWPSPSTPSFVDGKGREQRNGSGFSMNETAIGEILECSVEEMNSADVAGILGVLYQDDNAVSSGECDTNKSPTKAPTVCISAVASPKDNLPRSHSISIILDLEKTKEPNAIEAIVRGRSMTSFGGKSMIMTKSRIRNESHERIRVM